MKIKLNGKEREIDGVSATLEEIVKIANVENPDLVSIQLNGEFVSKEKRASVTIKDGDGIDFAYFMGGGIL